MQSELLNIKYLSQAKIRFEMDIRGNWIIDFLVPYENTYVISYNYLRKDVVIAIGHPTTPRYKYMVRKFIEGFGLEVNEVY